MIHWLFNYLLRRGLKSRRAIVTLGQLESLACSGTGAWALAQEKARLEYLAAKECFEKTRSGPDFERAMISLLQLTSTNAVIQSLINEHMLEQLVAASAKNAGLGPAQQARRSA